MATGDVPVRRAGESVRAVDGGPRLLHERLGERADKQPPEREAGVVGKGAEDGVAEVELREPDPGQDENGEEERAHLVEPQAEVSQRRPILHRSRGLRVVPDAEPPRPGAVPAHPGPS